MGGGEGEGGREFGILLPILPGLLSFTTNHSLSPAFKVYNKIIDNDPNDLEQHFAAGFALQMAGQDNCEDSYRKYCLLAEAYHVTIPAAIEYYNGIVTGMVDAGVEGNEVDSIRDRILLLTRFEMLRKHEKKGGGQCNVC